MMFTIKKESKHLFLLQKKIDIIQNLCYNGDIRNKGGNFMLLSLDLSTKSSGWAIFDGDKLVNHGCITSA